MIVRPLDTVIFLNLFTVFCLLLAIFGVTYFFISLIKTRLGKSRLGATLRWSAVVDFSIGLCFGSTTFLAFFLQRYFMGGAPTVLVIDFVLIIGWMLSAPLFWGASVVALGSVLYQRSLGTASVEWISNMIFLGGIVVFFFGISLFKRRWSWMNAWIFFLFLAVVEHGLLAVSLYAYSVSYQADVNFYLIATLVALLFTSFGYGVCLLVNRGLSGTKKLSTLARNDFGFFIKQTFARDELHDFIGKNNVSSGILLSFFSNPVSEKKSLQTIYDAVHRKYADSGCLLISLASRYPTVFIPIREQFGSVNAMTEVAKSMVSVAVVDLIRRLGPKQDFRAFFSLYGAHAASAKDLLHINLNHLLSPGAAVATRLSVYDPKSELANEAQAASLDSFLQWSEGFKIEYFFQDFLVGSERQAVYQVQLMSFPLLAFNSKQCIAAIEPKYRHTAIRYYALQSLRSFFERFAEGKVTVYYPWEIFMDKDFSLRDFLTKMAAHGLEINRIVFCLNLSPEDAPTASQLRRLKQKLGQRAEVFSYAITSKSVRRKGSGVDFFILPNGQIRQGIGLEQPLMQYHKKV